MIKKLKTKLYPYKQYLTSLFRYPNLIWRGTDYDRYWRYRKLTAQTPLNSFQKKRADLALRYLDRDSSVLDIGGGNGRVLLYVNEKKHLNGMVVADISQEALRMARENNIDTVGADISKIESLKNIPSVEYMFMFEILEHVPNSEEMLEWALSKATKGVFFSVPNTGFLFHRLRLLFGRFPLQWRLRPSEHLRFWTAGDMKWWLGQLNIKKYNLHLYEGIGLLNIVWPALFGQGMFVYIPVSGFDMPHNQAEQKD